MIRGYLALGSNMGDKRANLDAAAQALGRVPGIAVRRTARVYRTTAVGPVRQDDFLNTVVEIETALEPGELLDRCREIEGSMGRVRREPQGPRPIDIDIIWLDRAPVETPRLRIPHPRAHQRRFVLVPLQELAPGLELAGHGIDHWLPESKPNEIFAAEARSR